MASPRVRGRVARSIVTFGDMFRMLERTMLVLEIVRSCPKTVYCDGFWLKASLVSGFYMHALYSPLDSLRALCSGSLISEPPRRKIWCRIWWTISTGECSVAYIPPS